MIRIQNHLGFSLSLSFSIVLMQGPLLVVLQGDVFLMTRVLRFGLGPKQSACTVNVGHLGPV